MKKEKLELIRDYLDDRIDAKGLDRLNRLLETDADARTEFRALATLEEGLRDLSVTSDVFFPKLEVGPPESQSEKNAKPRFATHPLGIAALLAVFIGVAILLSHGSDRDDDWGDAIARIDFLSEDANFESGYLVPDAEGELLTKGWVHLDRGRVRILFRSGARVEAEGPVALGIDTPMRAYLDFGKVTVHAPGTARDFVVATESMEVVDLGTRFEVEVDPQSRESNVSVIEGLVDLHLGSRGAERRIRPLEAGFAARVDAFGEVVEITTRPGSPATAEGDDPSILAHWTFDEASADGSVEDSAGNNLHGTLLPETQPRLVPGVSGRGLELSTSEAVDLRDHLSAFVQLKNFTVAAWVRDPGRPLAMLFSCSGESEQHRVQFLLFPQHIDFGWQNGPHYDAISGRVDGWEPGRWYHVTMTVRDGLVRLYRNGELLASGLVGSRIGMPVSHPSIVKSASHAYIGRLEDGRQGEETRQQWFNGAIDDFQLYSGALNHEAVRFLFEHPGKAWTPDVASD